MDVQALVAVGGQRWQKGTMDRVYFENLARWYGLETTRYGSGKISSATLDGEHISNGEAHKLAVYLLTSKLWYDVLTGRFQAQGLDAEDVTFLAYQITQAAEKAPVHAS